MLNLATVEGNTEEDWNNKDAKSKKTVFVGVNGGISIG